MVMPLIFRRTSPALMPHLSAPLPLLTDLIGRPSNASVFIELKELKTRPSVTSFSEIEAL
jgi:hypothetical protein